MQTESALEAQRISSARGPNGLRRLSLAMLATGKLAEDFKGTTEGQGATRPGQVLAAFKAAAPHLGLSPRVVHAIDWLFTFTQPQDWCEGSRPIVWPSAALQRDTLGLAATQAKTINRQLVELGLVTMKDSPNGKRYGKRDRQGRIVEAYGFDLSPLFTPHGGVSGDRGAGQGAPRTDAPTAPALHDRPQRAVADPGYCRRAGLHRRHLADAGSRGQGACPLASERSSGSRKWSLASPAWNGGSWKLANGWKTSSPRQQKPMPEAVDSDPKGPENRPHQYNYKANPYPLEDTVVASEGSKSGVAKCRFPTGTAGSAERAAGRAGGRAERTDNGTVLRIKTDELVQLAPRLRPYLRTSSPAWPDIVEAADWLRHDLGVSKPLWGDACLAMGREKAAIALAIVSAKPAEHFTTSPGSYFYGMVTRAKAGNLNLARTIWGLRENPRRQAGASGRQDRAKGEFLNS